MCATELADHVAAMVRDLFEPDVAGAIVACSVFPTLVRVQLAAEQVNGTGTADWLVEWVDTACRAHRQAGSVIHLSVLSASPTTKISPLPSHPGQVMVFPLRSSPVVPLPPQVPHDT